ncbi:hypothetical protein ERJ75_001393100 [Trypanosoma vivax]|nr:hypothetical protein ERJ75_001393100 [Trypanosoma vivax]
MTEGRRTAGRWAHKRGGRAAELAGAANDARQAGAKGRSTKLLTARAAGARDGSPARGEVDAQQIASLSPRHGHAAQWAEEVQLPDENRGHSTPARCGGGTRCEARWRVARVPDNDAPTARRGKRGTVVDHASEWENVLVTSSEAVKRREEDLADAGRTGCR